MNKNFNTNPFHPSVFKTNQPALLYPSLLKEFNFKDWFVEYKIDGDRALIYYENGKTEIWSRHYRRFKRNQEKITELEEKLNKKLAIWKYLKGPVLIDSEMVIKDDMAEIYLFDLMKLNFGILGFPYEIRKLILCRLFWELSHLEAFDREHPYELIMVNPDWVKDEDHYQRLLDELLKKEWNTGIDGVYLLLPLRETSNMPMIKVYERAIREGYEGLVFKRKRATYYDKWFKVRK